MYKELAGAEAIKPAAMKCLSAAVTDDEKDAMLELSTEKRPTSSKCLPPLMTRPVLS